MRWLICLIIFAVPLLGSAQDSSVELLGVKVSKGMTKSYLSSVLPQMSCSELSALHGQGVEGCAISDDSEPGPEGEIKFQNGVVIRATRYWFFPEDANPYEVALMLNQIITRLVGENRAVCAKIEANPEITEGPVHIPGATMFVFPEKYLVIRLRSLRSEKSYIEEGLRVNPVPETYKVYGKEHQGKEWCGYVN